MIDLDEWKRRLSTLGMEVKGAAELETAERDWRRNSVYLVTLSELTDADGTLDAYRGVGAIQHIRQEVMVTVGVILAVKSERDNRAEDALDALREPRLAVQRLLLGWEPASSAGPVVRGRGALLQTRNKVAWWQDEYMAPHFIQAENGIGQ